MLPLVNEKFGSNIQRSQVLGFARVSVIPQSLQLPCLSPAEHQTSLPDSAAIPRAAEFSFSTQHRAMSLTRM